MATHSSILAWRIPIDSGAWRATVHGVTKSWTGLSDQAQFLVCRKWASFSLLDHPWVPNCRFQQLLMGKRGNAETKTEQSRNNSTARGLYWFLLKGWAYQYFLVLLWEARSLPRWRTVTSEALEIVLLPHLINQRKSCTFQSSPQILTIKLPAEPLGNSGFLSMSHSCSLLGPEINLSLLQTLTFQSIWPPCVLSTWTCVQ